MGIGPGPGQHGAEALSDESDGESGFPELLRSLRTRAGLSQNALARQVGIDASYLNRLEAGTREPPRRQLAEALAGALARDDDEADRLLVAAGHLPHSLAALGPLDPTIRLVAGILADAAIPAAERAELRQIIVLVARRWRPNAPRVQDDPRNQGNGG